MSRANQRAADTSPTRQPRQNRTYSVGLPAGSSFYPDARLLEDSSIPLPPPRRYSATPANVKPPIPKRNRNERPLPIVNQSQQLGRPWLDAVLRPTEFDSAASERNALDQASRDLGKQLQKVSGSTNKPPASSGQLARVPPRQQHVLRPNRPPKKGERGQRSPIRRQQLQQQQPSTADEDDEEDEERRIDQSNNKFTEIHENPRRLEQKQPELERRFHESRQEGTGRHDRHFDKLEKLPKATQTNLPPPPLSSICASPASKPVNARQDSNVSSDSFSQTSSPSYTSKTMEAPLLPHKPANGKVPGRALVTEPENPPGSPITKSISTPASLQAIVRFQNGSNSSLHHRIIRDMRRPSSHYVTRGRLRFRFAQVLINAVALMAIAGGLAAYFKSYPTAAIKVSTENKTTPSSYITSILPNPTVSMVETENPAPGICLPVIASFCRDHKIPYNFTVFPNYMGNFRQPDAQHELELYDVLIDVRCYELAALFLCTVFVPKCGPKNGESLTPCRNLCFETIRRCGFFMDVFGLEFPQYLQCNMFPDHPDSNVCVGYHEVIESAKRAAKPVCPSGFQCDEKRCIPLDWRCDGHVDCKDHMDEVGCGECSDSEPTNLVSISSKGPGKRPGHSSVKDVLAQASLHCGERRCMSATHICNGVRDCPWGQDERNCMRLSERNGDIGKGRLEVYHATKGKYVAACIGNWTTTTPAEVCSMLGYKSVDSWSLVKSESNVTVAEPKVEVSQTWRMAQSRQKTSVKKFQQCMDKKDYTTIDVVCSGYECGRRPQNSGNSKARTRIVGGVESAPGDWPFLAAFLGGPEQVFYCAGVLISDQWILTASHCVGNRSKVTGWTIQLGITRRHSHMYLGQKMKVKRVVPHPNYSLSTHDNDVALFQLEERVEFHEHLQPVCLPSANIDLAPGTVCTVIGWGKKFDTRSSEYEPAVNEVSVPVLGREVCNNWLQHKDLNISDGMICAGYPEGGKDACQGDSGGPLLCQDSEDKDRWFVGGIVSWGIKCAHPMLPGVYAYVPKYVSWIQKEINNYSEYDYG